VVDAGPPPRNIRSLAGCARVRVVRNDEVRADQAAHEPFGSYVCACRRTR
jgi:phenylacetate-CoA ligase